MSKYFIICDAGINEMFYRFHLEIISNLQKRNKNSTNTIPIHLNQIKLLLTFCPIYVIILILSIFAAGSQSSLLPQLFISIICLDSQVSVLFFFLLVYNSLLPLPIWCSNCPGFSQCKLIRASSRVLWTWHHHSLLPAQF